MLCWYLSYLWKTPQGWLFANLSKSVRGNHSTNFSVLPFAVSSNLPNVLFLFWLDRATRDEIDAPIGGATHDTYSDDGDWGWGDDNNNYTDDENQVEMGAVNHGWSSPPRHRGSHSSYSRSPSPPQRSTSGTSSNSGSPTSRSAQIGGLGPPAAAAPRGMSMSAAAKGLKLNQPSLLSPTPTAAPVLPRKTSPATAPAQSNDIFAELGLAAHPTFSHHRQHQHHQPATTTTPALSTTQRLAVAPAAATSSASTSPWKTNTTATVTSAFSGATATKVATAPAPAAAAADDWDNWDDDDDVDVKDEWDDNSDLDDLLDD